MTRLVLCMVHPGFASFQDDASADDGAPKKDVKKTEEADGPGDSDSGKEGDGDGDGTLYCICRGPDTGTPMVRCDGCDEWFHYHCLNLKKKDMQKKDHWVCPTCAEIADGLFSDPKQLYTAAPPVKKAKKTKRDAKDATAPKKLTKTTSEPASKRKREADPAPASPEAPRKPCERASCRKSAKAGSQFCGFACENAHAEEMFAAMLGGGGGGGGGGEAAAKVTEKRATVPKPEMSTPTKSLARADPDYKPSAEAEKSPVPAAKKDRAPGSAGKSPSGRRDSSAGVRRDSGGGARRDSGGGDMMRRTVISTYKSIFSSKKAGYPVVDLDDLVESIETAMFSLHNRRVDNLYKMLFKRLASNLRKNPQLIERLFSGDITPGQLVVLSPEELGNAEAQRARKRAQEELLKNVEVAPSTIKIVMTNDKDVDRVVPDENELLRNKSSDRKAVAEEPEPEVESKAETNDQDDDEGDLEVDGMEPLNFSSEKRDSMVGGTDAKPLVRYSVEQTVSVVADPVGVETYTETQSPTPAAGSEVPTSPTETKALWQAPSTDFGRPSEPALWEGVIKNAGHTKVSNRVPTMSLPAAPVCGWYLRVWYLWAVSCDDGLRKRSDWRASMSRDLSLTTRQCVAPTVPWPCSLTRSSAVALAVGEPNLPF